VVRCWWLVIGYSLITNADKYRSIPTLKSKNMRITLYLLLICLGLLASGCHLTQSDNLEVSVSESEEFYEFTASYEESKTRDVQKFINQSIKPSQLFTSTDDVLDITTQLKDKTRFQLKSSPGKLKIRLNKQENTEASYERIKNMGDGLRSLLTKEN
jgi:hypothetical protein